MWRSKTRALLLRLSTARPCPIPTKVPPKTQTLILIPGRQSFASRSFLYNPRSFSSIPESVSRDDDSVNPNPSSADDSSLSSLWEETIEDSESIFETKKSLDGEATGGDKQINVEEGAEFVKSVIDCAENIESSFTQMGVELNEEILSRVIETTNFPSETLIEFFRVISKIYVSSITRKTLGLLVSKVNELGEISKKDAGKLWDLVNKFGEERERGLVGTEILNGLLAVFCKSGKPKSILELLEKFTEFGCDYDANTYNFIIEAISSERWTIKKSCEICEKLFNTANLLDGEKVSNIISLFCKGNKVKEAHSVYLMAKEKKLSIDPSVLEYLIYGLSTKDKQIHIALELLDEYKVESLKPTNRIYSSVIKGLCRAKDVKNAKNLLLQMVNSGPAPGNASFNYVITALSKDGDLEEAKEIMKVMESRGLRPDIYTYSVVTSGFAKLGMMDQANLLFLEAKKVHSKLNNIIYHIMIRGYCKMEQFDKAIECLGEMKQDGLKPNYDEYNKLIRTLCLKAMDWRSAERIFEEMRESGLNCKETTKSLIVAVRELEEEEIKSGVSVQE